MWKLNFPNVNDLTSALCRSKDTEFLIYIYIYIFIFRRPIGPPIILFFCRIHDRRYVQTKKFNFILLSGSIISSYWTLSSLYIVLLYFYYSFHYFFILPFFTSIKKMRLISLLICYSNHLYFSNLLVEPTTYLVSYFDPLFSLTSYLSLFLFYTFTYQNNEI